MADDVTSTSTFKTQSQKVDLAMENNASESIAPDDAVCNISYLGTDGLNSKPSITNEFSYMNMLTMDSTSVHGSMDCSEASNSSQSQASNWMASAYEDLELRKNSFDMLLCTEDGLKRGTDRHADDQDPQMLNDTSAVHDSYNPNDMYSGGAYQGMGASLLSSALGMSLGFEERVDFNVELSKIDIENHLDEVSIYEDGDLMQGTAISGSLEDKAPVLCELFTRKEQELKEVQEIARQEADLREQHTKKEETGAKKIRKRKTKDKMDHTIDTKRKKGAKTAPGVHSVTGKGNIMVSAPQDRKNEHAQMQGLCPVANKVTSIGKKGYTVKMQRLKNEKQLAPSRRVSQSLDNGFADRINNLRCENNRSGFFKQLALKESAPKESAPKKSQSVYKGKPKAPATTDDYKHALVESRKINTLLGKAYGVSKEQPLIEEILVTLFDKFLGYSDITLSTINLLPHFVISVKSAKDCDGFSSNVKSLADKVYSHLFNMYKVPEDGKFEAKYVAAAKKMGKINSRKGRAFLKDISTWDELD